MATLSSQVTSNSPDVRHRIDENGAYRIDNYDQGPPFAGFLPGIAGPEGVPLWCMYVNRGQGVISFGTEGKDGAILEFLPATWAYQLVGLQGFRTFIKAEDQYFEPFQGISYDSKDSIKRTLWIEPDSLKLEERNLTREFSVSVEYFTLVRSTIPALVRRMKITNLASTPRDISVLDGLPLIQPAGFTDFQMKKMRRLSEAYACARPINGGVFYSAKVRVHDEAEVEEVYDGHFYSSQVRVNGGELSRIEPLVDPDIVFGQGNDFVRPRRFLQHKHLDRSTQVWENRLACALVPCDAHLGAKESLEVYSLAGKAPRFSGAESFIAHFATDADFSRERRKSRELMADLTRPAFTVSSNSFLDGYSTQNYLDNILRGGIPHLVPSRSGDLLLHLYSRRHGDLERDYNDFHVSAHPLSDGPGNYRDICQNRRSDVWFYPEVLDREIRTFVSLIQADGYNPLSVKGYRHVVPEGSDTSTWCPTNQPHARAAFNKILSRPFSAGELFGWADQYSISLVNRNEIFEAILSECDSKLMASGHEGGYWVDHWTYIVDLLEAFEAVYPDRIASMLNEGQDISWFDEGAYVEARSTKYQSRIDGPLQVGAVSTREPLDEKLLEVTVLGKLVSLLAIKAVSLDYFGIGMEMEAGRPGWNDALNGLPGLFGSSTCEAAETQRLAKWLLKHRNSLAAIELPAVVADLINQATPIVRGSQYDWDRAATLRETYRKKLRDESSIDDTASVDEDALVTLLEGIVATTERGLNKAIDKKSGLIHTYYIGEPNNVKTFRSEASREKSLEIGSFNQQPLPLYLEGQVHLLRLIKDKKQARKIYDSVRSGPLYDAELGMYKLNECLAECSPKIGRARTFSRGWFENESIWLHMSYKYLLELLRCGLHQEFFDDVKTMFVPFMDPATYGRSILENSSFLASSACPDPSARGRGFVARLSGTTAEYIQIWLYLTLGPNPFITKGDYVTFQPAPILPKGWFTDKAQKVEFDGQSHEIPENAFGCAFLGKGLLVYHNESGKDTYGEDGVKPATIALDNGLPKPIGDLGADEVGKIRNRKVGRLDIWLR